MSTQLVVTKKRRGGRGKENPSYKRAEGIDMAYLCKRAGSPYWHVRKTMAPGKVLFKSTRTESKSLARNIRDEMIANFFGKSRTSFRKTVEETYEELRAFKETSLDHESYKNHYVYPWSKMEEFFGHIFLDDLSVNDWKRFVSEVRNEEPTRNMAGYYQLISGVLTFAIDAKYITEKPKIKLDRKTESEPDIEIFTDEEVALCLKNSEGQLHRQIKMIVNLGMRPIEINRLPKSFLDFESNMVRLPKGYAKNRKKREIPMWTLTEELRHWVSENDSPFLFPHPDNPLNSIRREGHRKEWEILRDSLGLKKRFYDFRHTCAVRMIRAGISPASAAKILGHDITMFYRKYFKPQDSDLSKEMEKMRNL